MSSAQDRLDAAKAAREKLAAKRDENELEQQAADEEKLLELETAYPDGFACVRLNAPMEGMPGFVAARDCKPVEYKRYQASIKVRVLGKDRGTEVDSSPESAAQLARTCLLYPDPDIFAKMCELRAGLDSGLGQEIVGRAQTRKADDAKK